MELSQSQDVVTESPEDLQLPSFDLSTGADSTSPLVSRTERSDGNDSDSSDWSSSSDESGGGEGGEGGDSGSLVRPSHHTSLISEWEWRTTHDDTTTQDRYNETHLISIFKLKKHFFFCCISSAAMSPTLMLLGEHPLQWLLNLTLSEGYQVQKM